MTNEINILVWGAKGGVGTSTLAAALADHHLGVLHTQGPDAFDSLGVFPRSGMTTYDFLQGRNNAAVHVWDKDNGSVDRYDTNLLVTDNTFSGLKAAQNMRDLVYAKPTCTVVIQRGPHGALGQRECQDILGVSTLWVPYDSAVGRACDAGTLGRTEASTRAFSSVFDVVNVRVQTRRTQVELPPIDESAEM
jgi:hypothetical protein